MKLPQKTRERLYRAKGKPITIEWTGDDDPRKGKRYAVYGDAGKLFSIRVEGVKRLKYETKATVRIDDDPVRILPGLSGTRNEQGDYEDEPERVHEDYEALLVREAGVRNRCLRAEHTGKGKLAREYAARQQKRLEAA